MAPLCQKYLPRNRYDFDPEIPVLIAIHPPSKVAKQQKGDLILGANALLLYYTGLSILSWNLKIEAALSVQPGGKVKMDVYDVFDPITGLLCMLWAL